MVETRGDSTAEIRSNLSLDVIGFILGPLLLTGWLLLVDTSAASPDGASRALVNIPLGLTREAHVVAGVMLLTVTWWLTEPIPIPGTGLLAVALCVFLGGVPDDGRGTAYVALAPFGNPSLYFLLGGMFIGRAMTRHGLDRRLALSILAARWAGRSPSTLLFAVGLTVALVSMFVSNTAATAMLYPITMGIVGVLAAADAQAGQNFVRSPYASMLLLMTAYASSVGGVATPIGTSTNVLAIGFFERAEYLNASVDFGRWALVGLPMSAVLLVALFFWLRLLAPGTGLDLPALRDYLQSERAGLGPWKRGEKNTLVVFLIVVGMWITPALLSFVADAETQRWFTDRFPEEITALLAPVLFLMLPVDWRRREFTLEAGDLVKVDWGTMLLFGAGLTLGTLMFKTGLAEALGSAAFEAINTRNVWVITALATAAGILLSELTSNSATVSTLFPVIWSLCKAAEIDLVPPLMGLTFGASFGSAMPVSTPPNAIVYGSGVIPMRRMIGAGIGFDIVCGLVIWTVLWIAFGLGWSPFRS